jgi:hypothetical protein
LTGKLKRHLLKGATALAPLERGGPLNDYRLHLDLYSSDPRREVQRLVRLGGKISRVEGEYFVTLADPDGNLFDVVDKRGWSFRQLA